MNPYVIILSGEKAPAAKNGEAFFLLTTCELRQRVLQVKCCKHDWRYVEENKMENLLRGFDFFGGGHPSAEGKYKCARTSWRCVGEQKLLLAVD